ncbi:MAG: DUF1640 domain-containing protein [Magnetococcales bacterium]|nr:DUF1640 domain-containing protein [Magnetococcales bacterium]
MTTATFDTLEFAEELRAVGIPDEHAKAQARALSKAMESKDLVTKEHLDLRLEALKVELIKWVIGMFGVQIAVFALLLKLFIP